MLTIKIEGKITIDDMTAEILEYVVRLGPKEFMEKFGTKYKEGAIDGRLRKLREELRTIIDARKTAIDAVNAVNNSVRINQ